MCMIVLLDLNQTLRATSVNIFSSYISALTLTLTKKINCMWFHGVLFNYSSLFSLLRPLEVVN